MNILALTPVTILRWLEHHRVWFSGNDFFYFLGFANEQVFVGGEGADKYKIDSPGFMTMFDGGYRCKDVVQATGIGVYNDSTWVATIDGGQHLGV